MQAKFTKTIFTIFLCNLGITAFSQSTQSVNIIFSGINSKTKNYKVILDGNSFFSNKNYNSGDNNQNTVVINDLEAAKHTIKLYRLKNNNPKYNKTSKKTLVYSKTFDLREGYDMDITINASGRVQFSENSTSGNDQSNDKTPMASNEFNKLLQSVKSKWSQALKGETESEAFNNPNNYFSTSQIRQLLTLIASESDRLDLAQLSYRSATDSANFSQLYDLFKTPASRDALNDFLRTKGWDIPTGGNLKTPMADSKFNPLIQSVQSKWSQALKGETISEAFNNPNNYFSTNQIRQFLTLITLETDRLDLAKLSYRSVTDSANFTQLYDLFKTQANRDELNNFLRTKGWNIPGGQNSMKTPMVDSKFNQLLQSVQSKWSQALKGETESEAFNNPNNYFSANQISQLLTLITLESDRLDLAKLSYRSVTDSANFTKLHRLFKTQANRDELNNFLRTKGWNIAAGQNNMRIPMADNNFNLLLQSVRSKWSEALRGETESEAFNNPNNWFSTAQIRQLLTLITSESDRLDLAKLSYRTVTDSANFIRLYDLFKIQASRDELDNFLRTKGWKITNNQTTGKTPMADEDFNQLLLNVRANLIQILKVGYVTDVFNNPNNYFSTNQIRQVLLLINSESNRLELAKLSYRTVTDRANFSQLNNLFNSQSSRDELANYVKNYRN